jgi:hypothetical protein
MLEQLLRKCCGLRRSWVRASCGDFSPSCGDFSPSYGNEVLLGIMSHPEWKNITSVFAYFIFKLTFTSFFKDKVIKKSQNSRNQGFSYYFCLVIEGAGSVPRTNGSGSGRPKNIRIRLRIRNTGFHMLVCRRCEARTTC